MPPTTERSRKSFPPLLPDQRPDWQNPFNNSLAPRNTGQISPTLAFNETPTSNSNVLSTHSIWSVSNAVTMDENRDADDEVMS